MNKKIKLPEGDKYTGKTRNGVPHGFGVYTYANSTIHAGEFKNGKENGKGTRTNSYKVKYVGEYKEGKYHSHNN